MAQLHKRKGGVFDDTAAAGDQPGDHVHLARLAKLLGANASAPGAGATQADIAGTPQAAALPAASAVVYSGNLSDYVLSADGLTTYVAGQDGTIRAYNAETGTLLQSWAITTNPGGLALSPDGGFLVVVETTPVSSTGSQWERLTTVVAHRIDLGTGAVTSFPFVATGYDDAFADVEILADGRAYFSQYFAGSGFTSIWALDFSTGQYQAILGNQKFAAPPALTSDPDSAEQLLLSITASSGGDQILVDISGGVPAVAASTSPLAGGFGIQAFSAEAGLIALRTSPGSKIYDTALHAITVPDAVRLLMNDATGLAFDSNGENLFLVHSSTGSIVQISTDSWQVVESFDLPDGAFTYNSHRGNELIIGPDARYFMILAGGMLMRIDNPTVADAITGTPGIDSLSGTAGNDVIIGYQSADVMTGFAGDDRYHVDTASDVVVEALGGGTDTVTTSVSYVLAADSEIEHLQTSNQLGSSPIELTGNALANRLTGNAAGNVLDGGEGNDELHGRGGNDRLEGGAGDDALNGGEGDDLLYGGEGADTAGGGAGNDSFFVDDLGDSTLEGAGEGNDTVWASVSYALTAGQHVEMLTFADAASTDPLDLTGNDLAQTITGNAGANRIDAGGGNDTLIGGGGADTLIGGTGDDVYRVEEAGDDVVEAVGSGSDTVYAVVSYALAAGSEVELLSAIDPASTGGMNLTGNELAQTIRGNAGDNQLSGGGGGDVLIGLGGNDFYFVGDVRDVVTEAAGGGNDRIFAGASHVLAAGSEVEILSTDFSPGTAAINLTGNALAQAIYGNAG
ncbi:MAG TPA: calcium-binding protein, partial [Allosphingosinicella sp.]|nr:calcium-binding protein [Allosphingosinicella sp.]